MTGKTKHKEPSRANYKAENRREKNKAKKLQRHLKAHPNDVQSKNKESGFNYTRKKPLEWWVNFGGVVNKKVIKDK